MKSTILVDTATYRVTSYGNGLSYTFACKPDKRSVFFQGDDAAMFRNELEAWETHHPDTPYESILAWLWGDYVTVSQPDEGETP